MAGKFDWKSVGALVAPMAPTLGKILGGFIPIPIIGPLVGQKVGEIIAGAFGVAPTPDAVANAIAMTPEAIVIEKLKQAVTELQARYGAIVELERAGVELAKAEAARDVSFITVVNSAMERETGSTSIFKSGWRPAMGWTLAYYYAAFGTMGIIALGFGMVTSIYDAWDRWVLAIPNILLFSIPLGAAVGITAWGKSYERGQGFQALKEAASSAGPSLSIPPNVGSGKK